MPLSLQFVTGRCRAGNLRLLHDEGELELCRGARGYQRPAHSGSAPPSFLGQLLDELAADLLKASLYGLALAGFLP